MGYTTSTIHGIEVPDSSEANNVPEDIGKVVTALEGGSIVRRLTGAAIAALTAPQKPAGLVVYNTTTGKLQISDGTNFTNLDATAVAALPKSGGTMTGAIAMGSSKVTGLADGTASGDAVNKGQLDTKVDTTGDTMTGDLTLNVAAGSNGWVNLHLDGVLRWRVGLADASGIGADFMVQRFNSSGVYIDSVFYIDAADGKANFPNGIKVPISGGIEYVF